MKIEIKPGDQTHVGRRFVNPSGVFVRILAVGEKKVFFQYDEPFNSTESSFQIENFNRLYYLVEKPKQKKLLAPALIKYPDGKKGFMWQLSTTFYSSLEEVKNIYHPKLEFIWPAIPNAQGYYEVEE